MHPDSLMEVLYRPPTPALRFLPEGPYTVDEHRFSWVAIQHGADEQTGSLNIYDWQKKTNASYALPGRPGFAFPTTQENIFVVGCEKAVGLYSILDGSWQVLVDKIDDDRQGTIINDGVVWEDNLIFGTKDLEFKTPKAGLYLYRGRDRKLFRLRDDQVCSNGKAVFRSPSGSLQLIDIDSPTRKIVAYHLDIENGRLNESCTLVDLSADPSVPDGMILTPDNQSLIVSMYNPNPADHGETRQYSLATGELEQVWKTPLAPQNTCPQLFQFDGEVYLIVTTAIEHMPSDRQSNSTASGSLFRVATPFTSINDQPKFQL